MNIAPPIAQKSKLGTCPHGLPQGACPICSGMGGGGGGASAKKAERPAGEMSWDQCYSVWQQMLKAKDAAQQRRNDALQAQMQAPINFGEKLGNFAIKITSLSDKLMDFAQKAQQNSQMLSKPILLATKILVPVLNMVKDVAVFAQKAINIVQQKIADISDKLNAIFGELKNATEKKISDKLKDFRKKFKSIFGIQEPEKVDDEEKKLEKEKRIFDLKTTFDSIKKKLSQSNKEVENADC